MDPLNDTNTTETQDAEINNERKITSILILDQIHIVLNRVIKMSILDFFNNHASRVHFQSSILKKTNTDRINP